MCYTYVSFGDPIFKILNPWHFFVTLLLWDNAKIKTWHICLAIPHPDAGLGEVWLQMTGELLFVPHLWFTSSILFYLLFAIDAALIRIFPVCYSDKHFVNFSAEREKFKILEHLPDKCFQFTWY